MGQPEIVTDLADQRDFWDSLQMYIISTNQKLSDEDHQAFIERSFVYSVFFRGCSALEIIAYQKILDLKDTGYVILLEFSELGKTGLGELVSDELKIHHCIKKKLAGINCAAGPLVSNRLAILITHDSAASEQSIREESFSLCRRLVPVIERYYKLKVRAGIGCAYNMQSVYSSFIDALKSLHYNRIDQLVYYPDLGDLSPGENFDYPTTERHLLDAIRLRKAEAYDYFGMLMNYIHTLSDEKKRNKLLELLVLAFHAKGIDRDENLIPVDYIGNIQRMMNLTGDQLIEFAYQVFNRITNDLRPQNSIDYSNHIVMATKDYLESHYTDDITLENMAEHVNISPQYFSKLIKKTTGFNFIDWLSMLRVKKAKELLNNSNLTVKEVCFMVGYKDPNYFSRIFKKRIGITPSDYVRANSLLSNKN